MLTELQADMFAAITTQFGCRTSPSNPSETSDSSVSGSDTGSSKWSMKAGTPKLVSTRLTKYKCLQSAWCGQNPERRTVRKGPKNRFKVASFDSSRFWQLLSLTERFVTNHDYFIYDSNTNRRTEVEANDQHQ